MINSIIPSDCISEDEYVQELEGQLEYYEDIISMLQARLEEHGILDCICKNCVTEFRIEGGVKIQ
jgi:hypothetical protein